MKIKLDLFWSFVCIFVLGMMLGVSEAAIYLFKIFTNNGQYSDGSLVDLTVDVTNGAGQVDFIFYNNSMLIVP